MRAAKIEMKALFDSSRNIAGEFLAELRYFYKAFLELGAWAAAVDSQLSPDKYEKRGEQIWIRENAKAAPSVSLMEPLIICANAELRHCAHLHGSALIGAGSVTGNSCEFKNSLLSGGVEVSHYDYAGDLILGYHTYMGAGLITSNIKFSRKSIVIRVDDEAIETSLRKIGVILGDYVEVGCDTVLNPDSVVGKSMVIYLPTSVRGPMLANPIVKSVENTVIKQS